MISPVGINTTIQNKKFNACNNKKVPFKGADRYIVSDAGKLLYRTTTHIFRHDLNWPQIFGIFAKEKPDKVYCYACSDGSEPYSIVMGLFELFGKEKAKKFLPVLARDIDESNINVCKTGKIDVTPTDMLGIEDNIGCNCVEKYFPVKYDGYKMMRFANNDLRNAVEFRQADFIKNAENIDYDNSMIFCRNVWPYFKPADVMYLADVFSKKFTEKTKLILGSFDRSASNDTIAEVLKKIGNLVEDENCPNLFRKNISK